MGKYYIIAIVVTLIALKREVAAYVAGVPWSECQVRKLATSHCTNFMSTNEVETTCWKLRYTRENVQSPLVVLLLSAKRRRLFLWQVK
jgi:hypothetical protein